MGTAIIPAPNLNVKKTDIVNNLTSTNTDKPLSAAQGKALNDLIAQSTATLDSHIKAHNLGNITTLSAFQNALDSMVSGITGVGFYEYMFTAYFSGTGFAPFNISNSQVFGSLTIAGENRYNIMVYNHANIDNMWRGTKLLTTWSWTKIANEQSTAFDTLFHNVNNVSGTTDANGNLLLPVVATGERHAVIFAWDGTHVFIPFYYSGNWYCRVQYSNAVGDPYANQNVTCSYYYI